MEYMTRISNAMFSYIPFTSQRPLEHGMNSSIDQIYFQYNKSWDWFTQFYRLCSIVAVHGLNPTGKKNHAFLTWTGGNGEVLWLRDLLKDKIPNARILLFGYNSNVAFESSKAGVLENAESLLSQLDLKRNVNISPTTMKELRKER